MAHIYTEVEVKGITLNVVAEGHVSSGGSNYYGSDEPAWVEVEDLTVYAEDGRKLSKRLEAKIIELYGDSLEENLIESEW